MSKRSTKPRRIPNAPYKSDRRAPIDQALATGDIAKAAALAERALKSGQSDPMLLNLAAWGREEVGDFAGAHQLLRRALALAPGDVLVLGAIGAVLRKEGQLTEALAVLDQAVTVEPRHAAAWLERGYVLDALRSPVEARRSYSNALALDAGLAPALGKLADSSAKDGDLDAARSFAARALALDPREPSATAALAMVDIEARDGAAAEKRLRALLTPALRGDDRTRTLTLLGDALDRQDRANEAWDCWTAAQANFRSVYASSLTPSPADPSHRRFIETISAQITPAVSPRARASAGDVPGSAATHVFLLGYPRSGTTLVENVLASDPRVVALEERDTLVEIDAALIGNDGTMPDLDTLDDTLIERLRVDYWRRVHAMAGDVAGKTFVDMNPFNGAKLPVIARIFPDARILVMRRDPRDVVLSCFRINFTPSSAAWAFSDLEETARHYAAMMQLIERAGHCLPLAMHEVRYDRMITDFETTVAAFADFVGLEWTEAFRRFDRTARNRGVQTASATQVRRGLYDGRNQWRRYADHLAPVMPILEPWIERLGFKNSAG